MIHDIDDDDDSDVHRATETDNQLEAQILDNRCKYTINDSYLTPDDNAIEEDDETIRQQVVYLK